MFPYGPDSHSVINLLYRGWVRLLLFGNKLILIKMNLNYRLMINKNVIGILSIHDHRFFYRIQKLTQLPRKVIQAGEWMQVSKHLLESYSDEVADICTSSYEAESKVNLFFNTITIQYNPFIDLWVFIHMQINLIFIRMIEHQASFWKRDQR